MKQTCLQKIFNEIGILDKLLYKVSNQIHNFPCYFVIKSFVRKIKKINTEKEFETHFMSLRSKCLQSAQALQFLIFKGVLLQVSALMYGNLARILWFFDIFSGDIPIPNDTLSHNEEELVDYNQNEDNIIGTIATNENNIMSTIANNENNIMSTIASNEINNKESNSCVSNEWNLLQHPEFDIKSLQNDENNLYEKSLSNQNPCTEDCLENKEFLKKNTIIEVKPVLSEQENNKAQELCSQKKENFSKSSEQYFDSQNLVKATRKKIHKYLKAPHTKYRRMLRIIKLLYKKNRELNDL